MRVNIQFSVNLDEVPNHVIALLMDADKIVADAFFDDASLANEVEIFLENNNYADAIKHLSDVRDRLVSLDHRLDDCMRILIGYHQHIANPDNIINDNLNETSVSHDSQPSHDHDDHGGFE